MLSNSNELIGQVLGTCTLQRLLGRGGMGAVYLARQSRPRRTVAVKVILPGLIEENTREQFLIRFRREADAIAALDHINIMPIYEYSEEGNTAYLVMPYVTGGTLRDRLEQFHTLPLEEAIHIINQAAAGLDSAHAQGIIHRDLKPGNMLFHADGRLLLADFGLAKVLKDVENSGLSLMTSAGTIIGTPEYLSPEQGTGNPLDVRTDVYSLGIVLYHMLTGRVPFTGTSPVAIAIRHAMVDPPPMRQFNPHITPNVEAVVMKAIAKAPEDRFSSAGELAQALRQAASQGQTYLQHTPPLNEQKSVNDDTNPVVPINNIRDKGKVSSQKSGADLLVNPGQEPPDESSSGAFPQNVEKIQGKAEKPLPEHPEAEAANLEQMKKTTDTATAPKQNEQIAALPTMHMLPDGNEFHNGEANDKFHNAETDENPHVPQKALAPNGASSSMPEAVTVADPLPPVKPSPKVIGKNKAEKAKIAEESDSDKQLQIRQFSQRATVQTRSRTTSQRARMVAITSFLILFVIGGLATYQYFKPSTGRQRGIHIPPPQISVLQKQTNGDTPTTQAQATPIALPTPPSSVAVGPMIYGTTQPASPCDKQGGQWTKAQDASVTCTADGAQTTAKQNMTGLATGIFLERLPHGAQVPSDFIIQTQVTVNPNSQGKFGIYFRSQPNDPQKSYLFLIDQQSAMWTMYYYNPNTNAYEPLNQTPVPTLLSGPVQGTVTIDLQISGNSYNVFINGNNLQGAETYTSWYPSGTIGLAVGQGANVTFKNVAIYAPPS